MIFNFGDDYLRDRRQFDRALEAVDRIKLDALYLAKVLRKYEIEKDAFSYVKSLEDLAYPKLVTEEEARDYSISSQRIKNGLDNVTPQSRRMAEDMLNALYFNKEILLESLDETLSKLLDKGFGEQNG